MPKKSIKNANKPPVVACVCSTCGQCSNARVGTQHITCSGFSRAIMDRLPPTFKDLKHPNRKGSWTILPPKADTPTQ